MSNSLTRDFASRTPPADVSIADVPNRILIVENEAMVALSLANLVTDAPRAWASRIWLRGGASA